MGSRFRATDREEKEGGNTWWVLFAGEEIGKGVGTWRRAAAAAVAHPVVPDREGEGERTATGAGGDRAGGGRWRLD